MSAPAHHHSKEEGATFPASGRGSRPEGLMNTLLTSTTVLADSVSLDRDTVTPGVLGFLVIFVIGVGLYFLMRSLLGKLRALPKDDDFGARAGASAASAEDEGPKAAGPSSS